MQNLGSATKKTRMINFIQPHAAINEKHGLMGQGRQYIMVNHRLRHLSIIIRNQWYSKWVRCILRKNVFALHSS